MRRQAKELQEDAEPVESIYVLAEWVQKLASSLCEATERVEASERATLSALR